MGSGEPSITRSTSSSPSRASRAMTHVPSGSIPRRPARPAIWVSSLCDSARNPRSVRLVSPWRTTDRAGMWMPRDIVSVAKTALQSPRSKSPSMSRLRLRRVPRDLMDLARQVRDHVAERHRAMGMVDRNDRPVDDRDPVGDLLDVGDGRGEANQHDVRGSADDDLLPDGAAPLVAHVVTLVEYDVAEPVEAAPVERVAEDLGGHDEDGGVGVHLDVAGEDPDRVRAELAREVGELLVRERLERSRVG